MNKCRKNLDVTQIVEVVVVIQTLHNFIKDKPMSDVMPVVQINEDCNLRCTYCYLPEFKPRKMEKVTLSKVIERFLDYNTSSARFIWHGGEPLALGEEF